MGKHDKVTKKTVVGKPQLTFTTIISKRNVKMTDQQLHDLIIADSQAKAMADVGNDSGCAERCSVIAPKVRKQHRLTELGLYGELGVQVAEPILAKLEAYTGTYKAPVKRMLKWLQPGSQGLDFGDAQTLQFLGLLQAEGTLTQPELVALDSLSLVPDTISHAQVSSAWAIYRQDGKVDN